MDEFYRLKNGYMTKSEYEVCFHELSKYVTMIIPTKYKWICYFVIGLRLSLERAT